MSKAELDQRMIKIASVIATLQETNGSPESMLYIFFDMNIHSWTAVRDTLRTNGLIKISGNFVTLTEKGEALATRLNKAIGQ